MTFVAYAVALALLGWAGAAFWMREKGAAPQPAPVQQMPAARSLKLPPRPAPPEATKQGPAEALAPAAAPASEPVREPAASSPPSKSEATSGEPATAAADTPDPTKPRCTADVVGAWPSDKTDQGMAIQILLRDLGFYSGNTYGTVGPATRAAIRKFETATDQAETGEPTEMLFESLKKKCASPVR